MREIALAPIEALSNSLEGCVGKNNSIGALIEVSECSAIDDWIAAFETHALQVTVSIGSGKKSCGAPLCGQHCCDKFILVYNNCKPPFTLGDSSDFSGGH